MIFLSLLFALNSPLKAQAGTKECIARLSAGQNSLGVKLNSRGLTRFFAALSRSEISNKQFGLFIDYSINSTYRRAFLIDAKNCDVKLSGHTLHGGRDPETHAQDGDPDDDGILDACINRHGTRKYMTRPGAYLTGGCRRTSLRGWPALTADPECTGIGLIGLDRTNQGTDQAGVKLHEHTYLRDADYIKPLGQGCPAFAPGVLKPMLNFGLLKGSLAYAYAPQCESRRFGQEEIAAPNEAETQLQ